MRIATLVASTATAALLFAGAAQAQTAKSTPDYLMAASQSDQFEIQEGQMAQSMAMSPKLKHFGAEMVRDHTKSTKELTMAAKKAGMTPDMPPLRPDQQQMIATLQGKTGADFDRTYIDQQTQSHQEALQVQTDYAQGGDNPTIKKTAAKIVPVVQKHLKMLQSMSSM